MAWALEAVRIGLIIFGCVLGGWALGFGMGYGEVSLNRSEPAKKSGQNIAKNRCRTTIAERMVETLAELPFIGDQVVCLSHDQASIRDWFGI